MLIRSVTAHAFGPLLNERLEFADGMTVIHGGNESAKSTWHAAIYAAICGRRRGRVPRAEERRFAELHRPWDREDWVVRAEVLLDDGRRLEIRQDLAGRVDCDVRDLDLGRDCSAEFISGGDTPDLSRWLGLDRQSFLATACVAQAQVLAIHGRPDGLQEQLQRAADTAGADSTAAAALALIESFRRDQVGTDRASTKPLRLARLAVDQTGEALDQARTAHALYERRLVEADRLRLAAGVARRQLRRHDAVALVRAADGLRHRSAEVEAVLVEVGDGDRVLPVADESIVREVTTALSTWDNRPAEPAAPVSPLPLAQRAEGEPPADRYAAAEGGAPVVVAQPSEPSVRTPRVEVEPGHPDAKVAAALAVRQPSTPPTEPSRHPLETPAYEGFPGGTAAAGATAGEVPAGRYEDVPTPPGPDASRIPAAEMSTKGRVEESTEDGSREVGPPAPRSDASTEDTSPGLPARDAAQAGTSTSVRSPEGRTSGPRPTPADGSEPAPGEGPAAGEVSATSEVSTASEVSAAGEVWTAGEGPAREEEPAVDEGPGADRSVAQLWDLARDLDVVPPPADERISERVAVARAALAAAAGRRRGRRGMLWCGGAVAVLAVLAAVVGLAGPTVGAAGFAIAGVLVVVAVGLALVGVRGSRPDVETLRQDLDAALVEAGAALRAEQAAVAHRERAQAQAQRWGLPSDAEAVRRMAQQRVASAAVAEHDQRWRRQVREAEELAERARRLAEAEAHRRVEQARVVAEQRARAEVEMARGEAERVARERVEHAEAAARQRFEEARALAEERARLQAEQARRQADEARRRIAASQQDVAAAQRLAEQAQQLAEQSRRQVEDGYRQIVATRQRMAEQVVAVAGRCGLAMTDPDEAVVALRRWQHHQSVLMAERDLAAGRWSRLENLLGLVPQTPITDIRAAAVALRHETGEAQRRASRAAEGFTAADMVGVTDTDPAALESLRELVRAADKEADAAEGSRQALAESLAPVGEREEDLARAQAELQRLRELDETLELTRTFLTAAQERAHRSIAPVLVNTVGRWLPLVTAGRYTEVIVDPQRLRVQVRGPASRWRDADALSHGTAEQVYLLLRLALAQHLSRPGTVCPLLLDDVTVHADADRTEQILELLLAASADRQIILFSQQEQVRDWAEARLDPARDRFHALPPLAAV